MLRKVMWGQARRWVESGCPVHLATCLAGFTSLDRNGWMVEIFHHSRLVNIRTLNKAGAEFSFQSLFRNSKCVYQKNISGGEGFLR